MSPVFEPESPRLQPKQQVKSPRFRIPDDPVEDVRSSVSEVGTSLGSPMNEPTRGNVSPKRKRVTLEDVSRSSPLKSEVSTPHKRPRHKSVEDHITEIPSTPERGPMLDSTTSEFRGCDLYGVVDLEADDDAETDVLGMPASQSLSEPDRSGHRSGQTTQQVFQDPSQSLDLDLAAPDGGWEDELFLAASAAPPIEILETQQGPQPEDTQKLLTGQTQIPDFSVPEPDGGWDALIPSSPTLPEFTQPAAERTATKDGSTAIGAWMDKRISSGIAPNHITVALKCTCMDVILAKVVLESLVAAKGVPKEIPGVWTEQDDEDLRANDSRRIKRVQDKHGTERFSERWTFLDDYDNAP